MDDMTVNIAEIIKQANTGCAEACAKMDALTGTPSGTYASIVENFEATKVAAEMGSVECMEILGQSYYTGLYGVEKNPEKAIYWLEKASEKSATATWYLGQIEAAHNENYALADDLMKKAIKMGISLPQEEIDFPGTVSLPFQCFRPQWPPWVISSP